MTPIEQAIEALETAHDLAVEAAAQVHEAYKGYKPQRHAAADADVKQIADALSALRGVDQQPVAQTPVPAVPLTQLPGYHVLMITTAYEQGVGKGRQLFNGRAGIVNPYGDALCKEAWRLGCDEGFEQARRKSATPPPAHVGEPPKRLSEAKE